MVKKITFLKIDKEFKLKKADNWLTKTNRTNYNFPLAIFLNTGYYIITPLIIGIFLGLYLDRRLKTGNIFTLIFIGIGAISSLYNLYKLTKKEQKNN